MERVRNKSGVHRYERKVVISSLKKYEIESIIKLHPAIFSEIYSERYVNNIYFDALNMKNYFDNIDGIGNRIKVRIRWYGNLFGMICTPILEIKTKDGFVGRKERVSLGSFFIDESFKLDKIKDVIEKSEMPDILKSDLNALKSTLLNRYCRKYFLSADQKYRVTVDSNLEFYQIGILSNTFLQKSVDRESTVVELKYDEAEDPNATWLFSHFPFRINKNSKYVTGIERLYAW